MKNKTVVIALNNAGYLTNFENLTPRFTRGGYDIIIHTDPQVTVVDNELKFNFDYLVDGTISGLSEKLVLGTTWREILPVSMYIGSHRSAKWEMQVTFKEFMKSRKTKFVSVPTYVTDGTARGKAIHLDPDTNYVLKMFHGARGMGQFLFSPKYHSVEKLVSAIKSNITPEDFSIELGSMPNADKLVYSKGKENRAGESFSQLQGSDLLIQQQIENIVTEYRVIASIDKKGVSWFAHTRSLNKVSKREQPEFRQATGADGGPIDFSEIQLQTESLISELKEMGDLDVFNDMLLAMLDKYSLLLSFDLFITETGKEKRWGLFELSNQFGTVGPGETLANEYTEHALVEAINRLNKKTTINSKKETT